MWTNKLKDAALAAQEAWHRPAAPTPALKPESTGLARVAENATAALGRHLQSIGKTLAQHDAPIGVGSAASFTASKGLETAGKYFENAGFDGTVKDLGERVKKNPIPLIAVSVAVGLILGRLLPSRRS